MRVVKCIMKVCARRVTCVGLRNRCRKNISTRLSLLHVLRFSVKRARCLFFHQSVRWIAVDHLSTSLFLHVQAMHQDSGVWLLSRLIPANVLPCLQLFPQDARCLTRAIHRHLALRSICYDDVERGSEVISAAGAMIGRRLRGKDNKRFSLFCKCSLPALQDFKWNLLWLCYVISAKYHLEPTNRHPNCLYENVGLNTKL